MKDRVRVERIEDIICISNKDFCYKQVGDISELIFYGKVESIRRLKKSIKLLKEGL